MPFKGRDLQAHRPEQFFRPAKHSMTGRLNKLPALHSINAPCRLNMVPLQHAVEAGHYMIESVYHINNLLSKGAANGQSQQQRQIAARDWQPTSVAESALSRANTMPARMSARSMVSPRSRSSNLSRWVSDRGLSFSRCRPPLCAAVWWACSLADVISGGNHLSHQKPTQIRTP